MNLGENMRRDRYFKDADEIADFIYDRRREREINGELERGEQRISSRTDELKIERFIQRMPARLAAFQVQPPKPECYEPKLPFTDS
jgi:5'-deoxynucleotidase YfbR-like HD superfamily hydrolase